MNPKIPAPLSDLAAQLGKLPGMGPKSAMRIVMTLLAWPEERTRQLGQSISELRDRLHICSRCGGLATSEVCAVCADPERNQETLCLVADWDSMMTLDSGGFYRGQYLILGGLLNPLEHRDSSSLHIGRLERRLQEGVVKELIFALGATVEADNTAVYLSDLMRAKYPAIGVSRLAQGIPLGGEVKHMDAETLRQSLKYRQRFSG